MKCKETEKMISSFLGDELDIKELRAFMEHIDECPECREELTIQFLVSEGMARIEEGSTFDLQSELAAKLDNGHRRVRADRGLQVLAYSLELAVIAAIMLIIFLVVTL